MAIYFYKKLWDAEIHTSWVCFDGIQRRYVSSENPPVEPNTSKEAHATETSVTNGGCNAESRHSKNAKEMVFLYKHGNVKKELSKNMPLFPSILDDELGEEVRNVTSEVNCAFGNNCQELEDSASASRLKFRPLSMELSHCENYAAGSTYEHVRLSKTASKAENDSFNLEASTLCSSSFELVNTKKSGKRHRCETCGKYFSFSSGLSRHKHTHSVNKPERSKQKVHLAVPSSTAPTSHSAVKAYRCQPCGKVFASCSYLKTHMRTHTGMKPFRCEHCGARSADRSSLRKHKLIHTGDRPYFCHRCKKRFAELKLLTQHLATHTEREPYTCKECGTRFAQYLLYKRHVRGHIGEKPFGCNLCGKCCAKASALKKHMLTHTKRRWFCRR